VRVGDGGGLQRRLRDSGRLGGLAPEIGVSEKTGSALSVVDDRDLEERVCRALTAEQLPARKARKAMSSMTAWVTRPPALRMTGASPSWSPRTMAGSTRWSRQVTTSICAAGRPSDRGV